MRDPTTMSLDGIGHRLKELEAGDIGSRNHEKLLDLILDLAQVQSDTMISVVLERLGEEAGSKDALKRAATSLKAVISAIRSEHESIKGNLEYRKTELEAIKAALDEQR